MIEVWSDLGEVAARILKPQGILVALSGTLYLPEVLNRLGDHLQYGWTYAEKMTGGNNNRMLAKIGRAHV